MEKIVDFYQSWLNAQTKLMKNWMETGDGWRRSFQGETRAREAETMKRAFDLHETFMGAHQSWASAMNDAFATMLKSLSAGAGRETLANIFGSAETYMKLFEFWLPLYQALQEKTFDPAAYQQFFAPARYKEVLDKVFEFISPGNLKEIFEQALKYLETAAPQTQALNQQLADFAQRHAEMFSGFLGGDSAAAVKAYENILDTQEKSLGPMLKLPALAKASEQITLTFSLLKKYPAYAAQYGKFQNLMYTAGQKAMEKIMGDFARRVHDSVATQSYDEFFKLWAEANEHAYQELFSTEEFSTLNAQLQSVGLEIRKDFQRLMELALADYPVVLRSEMDELYKTIHELKRRIHDLENAGSAVGAKR